MKRPLLGIVIAFSAGILGEELLSIPLFYAFLFALVSLFLSVVFIKSKYVFLLFALSGFLFLGAFAYKTSIILPKNHIKNIVSPDTTPIRVIMRGKVLNRPNKTMTYFKQEKTEFLLGIEYVGLLRNDAEEKWRPACGILSAQVINPRLNFRYADEVVLEGELFIPASASNPGQFDYKKFLERQKIFYILKIKEDNFSKVVKDGHVNLIKLIAYKISDKVEILIAKFMPSLENAVLNAILLGRRRDIPDDVNDNFINTGTVHILSISGLHVGLLAAIFILLFKLLRLPFKFWVFILAVLLILYCAMVNNKLPVVRSTIMILVFLLGRVLKREQDLLNSLAFSALLILFFNPQDLFDIGFQLSFLTMGSIVYFPSKLEEVFFKNLLINHSPVNQSTKERVVRYFIHALLISFSAWLGSAPFIARYFNIISPITLLANIFVVPWMFFVLASSITFIIFGSISSLFGLIFSEAAGFSILMLIKMVSIFSKIPFSYFRVKSPAWVFIVGFYASLFLFFNRGYLKVKAKYFLIAALVFLNAVIYGNSIFAARREVLQISFLDVGKGDSIFVEFPKGGTMLIDGGEGLGLDIGRLVVSRFLGARGINKIDLVVATHPHTDHIGGLAAVLKNFKVRYFIDNGDRDKNHLFLECQRLLKYKGIKRLVVRRGDFIKGFGDTDILVLNPPIQKFHDLNNNSLVLRLKYKGLSVLFCADIEEEAARDLLLAQGKELPSLILKVPHHGGSLGDTAFKFIEKINPEMAVISIGSREVNGDVLSSLSDLGARIYRTDENGAIFLTNKRDKYSVFTFSAKNIGRTASPALPASPAKGRQGRRGGQGGKK